jgi:tetratricopeptide (TPR) repeat protein
VARSSDPDGALPTTATATPEELVPSSTIGGRVGRYVLLREIGKGGMGTVWEAYDPSLDRLIALKLVANMDGDTGPEASSLEREARALARVTDPRVVVVHDGGREGPVVFIAMELVRGRTLKEWMAEAERTPEQVIDVLVTAGRGLEAVHRAGLVHRDIKPSNILLGDDGRVCVGDLGIALADSIARGSGAYAGTPGYMAPEQRARRGADARSDQYAFCVTAWEALTGALPGAEATRAPPAALRGAIERGLAEDPEQRWPALGDLLTRFERWRGRRRRRWIGGGAATAVVAAAGALLVAAREPARTDACAATAHEIDAAWTPGRRDALAQAFAAVASPVATGAWQRTEGVLTGWIDRWRAARVTACDDTVQRRTQPAAVLARRERCLADRRDQLDALLEALARPDALSAPLAVSAAWALPAPEGCLAPSPPDAPVPTPDAAPLRAVRQQIARAAVLRRLGKPTDAVAAAEAAVRDAEPTGDRGLLAQALTELGHCGSVASQHDAAIEALRRAVNAADGAGLDEIRFAAWAELEFLIGEIRADKAEGARILEQVGALFERLPPDLGREAVLEERTGAYARIHGDYPACIAHATRAGELRRALDPGNLDAIAEPLNLVGICHERSAHEREALGVFEQVLELRRRALGDDHPRTAMIYNNLASVHYSLGEYELSAQLHEKALAARERVLGPAHRDVAQSHNNLANTLRKLGRADEALVHARAARDNWAVSVGPRTVVTATATAVMGHCELALGHLDEAERLYRDALAIRLEVRGPDHEDVTRVLGDLANVMVKRGRLADAIALADDAWTRTRARGDTGVDLASAEVDRLVIHAADPRRRAAAVERIRALCPALDDPDWVVEKADCEAFVARGGTPAP